MNEGMFRDVSEYWGDKMPMMAMEEMAELIKAISKYERAGTDSAWQNMVEEIGDVIISCRAIMCRYGIEKELVDKRIETKLGKKY